MTKTGRVYKIIPNEGTEIYVGSTFNRLSDRFRNHKATYKCWTEGKKIRGCSSFELFDKYGRDGCEIILIKEYEVIDRKHLEMYETLWICKMRSINKYMPFGYGIKELEKQKERNNYEANKEVILQKNKIRYEAKKEEYLNKQKIRYEANKEVILQKNKIRYEANKEVILQKNKEYREASKDKKAEKDKKYYEANKDKIAQYKKEYQSKPINCSICGKELKRGSLYRHNKAKHT
jgi:hypothetical protein